MPSGMYDRVDDSEEGDECPICERPAAWGLYKMNAFRTSIQGCMTCLNYIEEFGHPPPEEPGAKT